MATILPTGETTFLDANGKPLAGGTVTFYIPGTTTPKDTWQNSGQSILNSNPVTLDSGGRAVIYGSGSYRQVVQDSLGNTIWDQQTSEPNAGSVSFGGTSTGTANAQTLSAAQFSFLDGQIISFVAGITNTGTMTISVGGGAPIPVLKNGSSGPINLVAGDITAGNSYFIQYSAALASFQLLLSVAPSSPAGAFLSGDLFGLTLSNDGGDIVNNLDIATGLAASDGAIPVLMTLSSALVKKLNVAWLVGTNQGGLDTGTIANGTYHVFLIQRSDTGVVDVLFSISALAPTMPANYDRKRRIGSILRQGAAILPFIQLGDDFQLVTPVQDVASGFPATTQALVAISAPFGIQTVAKLRVELNNVTTIVNSYLLVTSLDESDRVPNAIAGDATSAMSAVGGPVFTTINVRTDKTSVIRFRMGNTTNFIAIATYGWVDNRGRV